MFQATLPEGTADYLYPLLAMVLLTFVTMGVLGFFRFSALAQRQYPSGYFKLLRAPAGAVLPARAEAAARNFINLFELPVLFYALVPLLILCRIQDGSTLALLWAFVAFRCLHTAIHVTVNTLAWRFAAYFAATLALLIAWLRFASDLLGS